MLSVENLSCRVGNFSLSDVNLNIERNGYFVLLGPTGSGKTTFLKSIIGLCKIKSGRIVLGGRDIAGLDPSDRNISYLPQDYSLFPHLDTRNNILFGLKIRKVKKDEAERRLADLAWILEIHSLLDRRIEHLSSGEKQRIALARALIVKPQVLLLDEPFSSIDPGLRTRLWFEVRGLLKNLNISVIHVTHNLVEASAVGDRLGVLINGRLEQIGTPDEIFSKPATEKVALYHGIRNIYDGKIIGIGEHKITIQCNGFKILAPQNEEYTLNQKVRVCIRPRDIKIIKEGFPVRDELIDNLLEGEIISSYFCDDYCTITVKSVEEFELRFPANIYKRYDLHIGKKITIGIWRNNISIFQ